LEYVDHGDNKNAMVSMLSDLGKHPDTENAASLAIMLMLTVDSSDKNAVRSFITGFN
jgi:hypothetical protein